MSATMTEHLLQMRLLTQIEILRRMEMGLKTLVLHQLVISKDSKLERSSMKEQLSKNQNQLFQKVADNL